jgi:hypothetical protein
MGNNDWLFGKKQQPRQTTGNPEPNPPFVDISLGVQRAGDSLQDLGNILRGEPRDAQVVCPQGHPIASGNNICAYGHFVG